MGGDLVADPSVTAVVRLGDTVRFTRPPGLAAWAAVGGKKEADGPLAAGFDLLFTDNRLGEETWEQAESTLQRHCVELLLQKADASAAQIDLALGGDLQSQCTATAYTFRGLDIPFAGVYGACSTMAEALGLAACLTAGGAADRALAMTSSHFCAAERQFRTPLNYGGKRTPTAQWTATGAGACLVTAQAGPGQVRLTAAAFGRVRDLSVKDGTNMGGAMAPAAAETLRRFFADNRCSPADYDGVYTGDLGVVGSEMLAQLLTAEGIDLAGRHKDCGLLLYDRETQQTGAGGSGAGCAASVLAAHILPALKTGRMRRALLVCTGALMSTTTLLQGESIPAVAHLVELTAPES